LGKIMDLKSESYSGSLTGGGEGGGRGVVGPLRCQGGFLTYLSLSPVR